jgi:hypothetical protein
MDCTVYWHYRGWGPWSYLRSKIQYGRPPTRSVFWQLSGKCLLQETMSQGTNLPSTISFNRKSLSLSSPSVSTHTHTHIHTHPYLMWIYNLWSRQQNVFEPKYHQTNTTQPIRDIVFRITSCVLASWRIMHL